VIRANLAKERGWWAPEKETAALEKCERGRGGRELRRASHDKNTTQHHNQVCGGLSERVEKRKQKQRGDRRNGK